jgi:hypothetical protein
MLRNGKEDVQVTQLEPPSDALVPLHGYYPY